MSKVNLELGASVIETVLKDTVKIPEADIIRGLRPPSQKAYPSAFYRSRAAGRKRLVSGARQREYEFEVDLYTRQGDVPEATAVASEGERLQELLFDALDAKTRSTFPTLVGLAEPIEVDMVTRNDDEDEDNSTEESRSRTVIRFPFWENL